MIYLFERRTQSLQIETRYSSDSRLYEIIWRPENGVVTRESFEGETSFRTRLDEIHEKLEDDDWNHVGAPQLLSDGWKI